MVRLPTLQARMATARSVEESLRIAELQTRLRLLSLVDREFDCAPPGAGVPDLRTFTITRKPMPPSEPT